jgi:hypothetical protein
LKKVFSEKSEAQRQSYEMDPLTSLKVFIIVVVCFTLVSVFSRFVLEKPPSRGSDRLFLIMSEIIGSVFVGMVATFQWRAFTGWRLPITIGSFVGAMGIAYYVRKVRSKTKVRENPINS